MRKLLDTIVEDYLLKLGYVDKYYSWVEKSPVDDWYKDIKLATTADCAAFIKQQILNWEEDI